MSYLRFVVVVLPAPIPLCVEVEHCGTSLHASTHYLAISKHGLAVQLAVRAQVRDDERWALLLEGLLDCRKRLAFDSTVDMFPMSMMTVSVRGLASFASGEVVINKMNVIGFIGEFLA